MLTRLLAAEPKQQSVEGRRWIFSRMAPHAFGDTAGGGYAMSLCAAIAARSSVAPAAPQRLR